MLLPSGHHLLIYSLYNPPKHTYKEADLMNYLIDFVDCVLEKNPDTVIVCGGDFNQLKVRDFETLSGWNALVGFPTRAASHLDNCLTNRPNLFGKAYPIHMLMNRP